MAALKWWLGSARQLRRGWFWNVWRKTERSKMRLEKGGRAQGEEVAVLEGNSGRRKRRTERREELCGCELWLYFDLPLRL